MQQGGSRNPGNGWALFGLARALELQHRSEEARGVQTRLDAAWSHADIKLTASAF